jgi:CheY-like chemotaxis protein
MQKFVRQGSGTHTGSSKEVLVTNGQRVLVIDEVSDTEEVLRAVLERRGVQVDRWRSPHPTGLPAEPAPDVVVIDLGRAHPTPGSPWQNVPQVIIGTAAVADTGENTPSPARHYLRKPFHYAELVQAVERLIARDAA